MIRLSDESATAVERLKEIVNFKCTYKDDQMIKIEVVICDWKRIDNSRIRRSQRFGFGSSEYSILFKSGTVHLIRFPPESAEKDFCSYYSLGVETKYSNYCCGGMIPSYKAEFRIVVGIITIGPPRPDDNDSLIIKVILSRPEIPNGDILDMSQISRMQNTSSQTDVSATHNSCSQTDVSTVVSTNSQTTYTFSETNPNHFLEILSEDLLEYRNNQTDSDCTLIAEGKTFHAHKLILSARSEVFRAMFRHANNEKREFEFPDLQASTLDDVLYYVYSGKVRGLTADTAASMFVASDTYAITDLRNSCLDFLMRNLTVGNVCEAADISHLYAEDSLQMEVVRFVKDRMIDVIESNEWAEFSSEKSHLAQRILSKALR